MKNRQEEPVTCPLCGSGMHPVFREGRVLFWGFDEFRGSTGCRGRRYPDPDNPAAPCPTSARSAIRDCAAARAETAGSTQPVSRRKNIKEVPSSSSMTTARPRNPYPGPKDSGTALPAAPP